MGSKYPILTPKQVVSSLEHLVFITYLKEAAI